MALTIQHSGQTFTAKRFSGGVPVWYVGEWLSRHKQNPRIEARLHKLNKTGVVEGFHPRGYKKCAM